MSVKKVIVTLVAAAAVAAGAPSVAAAAADLSVTDIAPCCSVVAGEDVTYTVTVSNVGDAPATGVTLGVPVPGPAPFASLSAPAGWSCATPAVGSGGMVSCTTATLADGDSVVFTLVQHVSPSATGTLNSTASVGSTSPDASPFNDTSTSLLSVVRNADLGVGLVVAPDPVTAGGDLTSTVTVTNHGPSIATGVQWTLTLPAAQTFVSVVGPGGWPCTTPAVGATGTLTCSTGALTPQTAVFTLVTQVDPATVAGTALANTIAASAATSDPDSSNNNPTVSPTVVAAAAPQSGHEAPSVFSLSSTTGASGDMLVIDGSGFSGTSSVLFGDTPAAYVVDGHRRITAVVPAGIAGTAVDVRVVNPWGTSRLGSADRFTYAVAAVEATPAARRSARRMTCRSVPSLVGRTLPNARRALRRAGCRVALRVHRRRARGVRRVVRQTPKPATALYDRASVTVTVR